MFESEGGYIWSGLADFKKEPIIDINSWADMGTIINTNHRGSFFSKT